MGTANNTTHVASATAWIRQYLADQGAGSVISRRALRAAAARARDEHTPKAVGMALERLTRAGLVRRVERGVYHYPRYNARLRRDAPPGLEALARAYAHERGWTITPDGAWAANQLGLSTQVPARRGYASTGPTAQVTLAGQPVAFLHAPPGDVAVGDPLADLVLQVLRAQDPTTLDPTAEAQLRHVVPPVGWLALRDGIPAMTPRLGDRAHQLLERVGHG